MTATGSPDVSALLDALSGALAEERRAMLTRDWEALATASGEKERLVALLERSASALRQTGPAALLRVRNDNEYNARLAARLSEQVHRRLDAIRAPTGYTRQARVSGGVQRLLHLTG